MTAPDPETPDPGALAREALALCKKATPGPLFFEAARPDKAYVTLEPWGSYARRGKLPPNDDREENDLIVAEFEQGPDDRHEDNARLYVHAGTHYATLATALLRAEARAGRLEAALAELIEHPSCGWTQDQARAALAHKEGP